MVKLYILENDVAKMLYSWHFFLPCDFEINMDLIVADYSSRVSSHPFRV